jgi:hypothetical protein
MIRPVAMTDANRASKARKNLMVASETDPSKARSIAPVESQRAATREAVVSARLPCSAWTVLASRALPEPDSEPANRQRIFALMAASRGVLASQRRVTQNHGKDDSRRRVGAASAGVRPCPAARAAARVGPPLARRAKPSSPIADTRRGLQPATCSTPSRCRSGCPTAIVGLKPKEHLIVSALAAPRA